MVLCLVTVCLGFFNVQSALAADFQVATGADPSQLPRGDRVLPREVGREEVGHALPA